jgi:RimJ/RimL family protein N-acetyltransferase
MKPVALDELVDRETYERLRPEYRERVIALKQRRRVAVGDRVSIVFENRETLRFQVLEMARVERIDDSSALQHELDVYNELVPGDGELSATLFVEIPDLARIRAELDRLVGIDEHVLLEVGDAAVRASFDPRQREEDRISAVQYIRFRVDPEAFARGPVRLRIDHPNYAHVTELSPETRASLLADLRGECPDLLPAGGRAPARAPAVRRNALGQPIGAPVPDWTPRPEPPRTPMQGRLARLEPLDADAHADALFAANADDAEGRMWTYLPYGPFASLPEYRSWIQWAQAREDPQFFAIVERASGRPLGVASYLRIDPAMGVIEVGHLAFSPALQRTAVATEAMFLMMRRAFDELGYRRYEWKCDSLNAPSLAAAARLGFSFEGIFRQAVVHKDRNRDTAWLSILDREWPALRAGFEAWLAPENFDAAGRQRRALAACIAAAQPARPIR